METLLEKTELTGNLRRYYKEILESLLCEIIYRKLLINRLCISPPQLLNRLCWKWVYRRCYEKASYVSNYVFFTLLHEWVDKRADASIRKTLMGVIPILSLEEHIGVFLIYASAFYHLIYAIKWKTHNLTHRGFFRDNDDICCVTVQDCTVFIL